MKKTVIISLITMLFTINTNAQETSTIQTPEQQKLQRQNDSIAKINNEIAIQEALKQSKIETEKAEKKEKRQKKHLKKQTKKMRK